MSVAFEHPSIREAISRAGVKSVSVAVNGVPNAFIGWSERKVLLLNPGYAWLSTDVRFLRLPQPIGVLRDEIDNSLRSVPTSREVEVLCTPLGQWRWALAALGQALNRNTKESLDRISELQRFGAKHWPGWYESALTAIREKIKLGISTTELLLPLNITAANVAVFEAINPLLAWSESGLKGNRIVALEDALCYADQEIADVAVVAELAASDEWWNEMEIDLSSTETALDLVRQGGGDAQAVLGDVLGALRKDIIEIREIENYLPSASHEEIHRVYVAVTGLQETLLDLKALRDQTRNLVWANKWRSELEV